MDKDHLILFKYATRGRPDNFFRGLESIINNLSNKERYYISCTIDEDDLDMNNDAIISRINSYKNTFICLGNSSGKIDAINRGMPNINWGILVNFSDDMLFNVYGFDDIIREGMLYNFPDTDGYLHYPEKDSMAALCVITICGKKYYDRFGYIYHPDYKSLFCDNEQMEVAKILGKYVYLNDMIFEHRNPAYSDYNEVKDEQFIKQQEIGWTIDQQTYNRRKAINFEL